MDWIIDYLPKRAIVRATTSGTMTFSGAVGVAADIAMYLCEEGATKYLIDHRAATIETGVVDLSRLVRDVERLGSGDRYFAAIVLPETQDLWFYNQRAARSAFRHRMFTDLAGAIEWLEVPTLTPVRPALQQR
jgi:hypothetical protein